MIGVEASETRDSRCEWPGGVVIDGREAEGQTVMFETWSGRDPDELS
jgi:hypothetical protein